MCLQDDCYSQHSVRQTRSTSCSDSFVSTLGLVWNYGVTAQSTLWRSHGCELLHDPGQQCVAARFVEASSDWLFPLAPHHLTTLLGKHFSLRCRHKVSPPALKSHQLLCYIAGYFRLAGGHLVMPWKAATEIVGFWPFGAFCDVWVAFDIMCSTASILNLCVISVDRYWAISSPFRSSADDAQGGVHHDKCAWTLSILISFIPVAAETGTKPRRPVTRSWTAHMASFHQTTATPALIGHMPSPPPWFSFTYLWPLCWSLTHPHLPALPIADTPDLGTRKSCRKRPRTATVAWVTMPVWSPKVPSRCPSNVKPKFSDPLGHHGRFRCAVGCPSSSELHGSFL